MDLQFVGDDPFGLIKCGSLTLKCVLHALSMTKGGDVDGYTEVLNEYEIHSGEEINKFCAFCLDEHEEYFDPNDSQCELFGVPGQLSSYDGSLDVLLLQLVDLERGQYRRIGLLYIGKDVVEDLPGKCLFLKELPCETHNDRLDTIRLI